MGGYRGRSVIRRAVNGTLLYIDYAPYLDKVIARLMSQNLVKQQR
jgi:hypothetical protein